MSTSPDPPPAAKEVVEKNVDAIASLHTADEESLHVHQRGIERFVGAIAVPGFLFTILIVVAIWVGVNLGMQSAGKHPLDRPPFYWLQATISLASLLVTVMVLITQRRQGGADARNAHLELQVSLLVDQKVAKIIQLIEEIRADSPMLRNRSDEQAEALQEPVDPVHLASVIADKLTDTTAVSSEAVLQEAEDEFTGE
jgi:uncharacterized membrane protein